MGSAMRSGNIASEYQTDKPAKFGKRKLKDFAPVFAAVYSRS